MFPSSIPRPLENERGAYPIKTGGLLVGVVISPAGGAGCDKKSDRKSILSHEQEPAETGRMGWSRAWYAGTLRNMGP
jgi:hypothetical protein